MALVLADRVQDTTTTTGTGAVTLSGTPPAGYQSFAVIGNGNTTYYTISGGSEWEVGIGTYTSSGTSLSRDTVLASSAGGTTKVTFSAGTKNVFVTYPAEKSVNLDASGNVSALGTVASGTWQGTTVATGYGGTGLTGFTAANNAIYSTSASALTAGTLPATAGGTGQSSYTIGDLLYASTTTALSKLADVAIGNALISGGVGYAPSWGKIGLTTHVSGTLPIANGGTNATATPTAGGISYGTGTAYAFTSAGTSGQVLTSNGASAPTWSTAPFNPVPILQFTQVVSSNQTLNTGYNGLSVGPVTVQSGYSVTVASGQRWVVI